MSRSKWKGPILGQQKQNSDTLNTKKNIKNVINRNSEIVPNYLGLTFDVYNGKTYSEVTVVEDMIGHKFGEFSFTRAKFIFKKKKKSKWDKK